MKTLRDEHPHGHAENRPKRLSTLVEVVVVEEEVGAELERLDASQRRVGEEAGSGEGVVSENEVVMGVGIGCGGRKRVEQSAETKNDEDAGELRTVRIVRRPC